MTAQHPEGRNDHRHCAPAALEALGRRLLTAAGLPEDEAREVTAHVVDNSLCGMDSHGVVRLPYYLDLIAKGTVKADAEVRVVEDTATTVKVDGGGGLGIPAIRRTAVLTAAKAKAQKIAVGALVNCGHTGRIGAFAELIAREGCFAQIVGGGGHAAYANVVPFGGREPAMSTNPYALAYPGGPAGAVVVDFATSATAQGKLMIARATGQPLAEGLILDKNGRPSRDPEDFYTGGAILPAAGPKGSGLGIMAELLGFALLGAPKEFHWLLIALDLEAFGGGQEMAERAERYLAWVKDRAPAAGVEAVMLPGEPEARSRERRILEGIPLPPSIADDLETWARRLGVPGLNVEDP